MQISGKNSVGILAQSVGGGGGVAGAELGVAAVPVFIGGQNGVVGQGGDVDVTNTGSIIIAGDNSIGIFAQSVGGGGGLVKPGGGAASVIAQSGGTGDGGTVTIDNTAGAIIVTGDNSMALYSQSVGGGGGAVGLAADPPGQIGAFLFSGTAGGAGAAQAIIVNQTGSLIALGANSIGLTAQSNAAGGNGDITVNINNASATQPSLIAGGSGQGAGVAILNGANNQLNNDGIITTAQGIHGFAIRGTTGDDHVNNNGLIIGSVDLGSGANSFDNKADMIFDSGVTAYLGQGNFLTNEGLLSPGAYQSVLTTSVTGNVIQSPTGTYGVDLDLETQSADRIDVTGTADVSGTVAVNLVDPMNAPGYALPGSHSDILVSAAGGETHDGISLQAPTTAVVSYSLDYPNATDIVLTYTIDYSPAGLTENERSVGSAVNRIQRAQVSPAFRPIATALFFQPSEAALAQIYDSLSGEGTSAVEQAAFVADDLFLSSVAQRTNYWVAGDPEDLNGLSLFGDKKLLYAQNTPNDSATDAVGVPRRAPRNWRTWISRYGGSSGCQGDAYVGSAETDQQGDGLSLGLDFKVSPSLIVGVAGGNDRFSFDVPDRETSGSVEAWHIAAYEAMRYEHLYTTAVLAYDSFDNDVNRHASIPGVLIAQPSGATMTIPGFDENLEGEFDSYSWSGYFETGYRTQIDPLELTPFAGLRFGLLQINDFTETTAGGGERDRPLI